MHKIMITSHSLGMALATAAKSYGLKESAFGAFLGNDLDLVWQATLGSLYRVSGADKYLVVAPCQLLTQTTGEGPMTQSSVIRNVIGGLESIFEVGLVAELTPFAGNTMVDAHGYQIALTSQKAMPWFFEYCQGLDRKATWWVDAKRLVHVMSTGYVNGITGARKCLFGNDSDRQTQTTKLMDKARDAGSERSGHVLEAGMTLECIELARGILCEMANMKFEYLTQNEAGVVDGIVVAPLVGNCTMAEQIATISMINQRPVPGILSGQLYAAEMEVA